MWNLWWSGAVMALALAASLLLISARRPLGAEGERRHDESRLLREGRGLRTTLAMKLRERTRATTPPASYFASRAARKRSWCMILLHAARSPMGRPASCRTTWPIGCQKISRKKVGNKCRYTPPFALSFLCT